MAMAAGTCSVKSACWEAHVTGSDSMRLHSRNVGGRRAPTMPCPRAVLCHFAPVQPKQRVRGPSGSPLICFLELLLRMSVIDSKTWPEDCPGDRGWGDLFGPKTVDGSLCPGSCTSGWMMATAELGQKPDTPPLRRSLTPTHTDHASLLGGFADRSSGLRR